MGSLCPRGDPEADNQKLKDGNELQNGPVKNRQCTDIACIPILIFAQVVFVVVTIAGLSAGDPTKLYKPRDFRGSYCGAEENWDDFPTTLDVTKLSYTMNVTATTDTIMKQVVCSTVAKTALTIGDAGNGINPILNTEEINKYLCDCCLVPCSTCLGSLEVGGDLTSGASLKSTLSGRMGELTGSVDAKNLFSPSGANKDMFSATSFWEESTKFFIKVCVPDCNTNFETINSTLAGEERKYIYTPTLDDPLSTVWTKLLDAPINSLTDDIQEAINDLFTFRALPFSVCPYPEANCVPFPGVDFKEIAEGAGYCTFQMSAQVIEAVGGSAAKAFEGLGGGAFTKAAGSNFGDWMGTFQETIDTFIVVSVLSFAVGIAFMVLLRFFLGICVWIAVGVTVFFFMFGGGACIVQSRQCKGVGFFASGKQATVAVTVAGAQAVSDAATGESASEEMTGDGSDYRGRQRYSINGKSCLAWSGQKRMPPAETVSTELPLYNNQHYGTSGLVKNYCRNPYKQYSDIKYNTIWCVTSDPEVVWEPCRPIGVIFPECEEGFAVTSEFQRDFLYYLGWVIIALGGVWVIIIIFMINRIRLAIALNKVAAQFLANNPLTLMVPIIQSFVGVVWCLLWVLSASFLLSQVPDSYIDKGKFATYEEAYGTTSSCAFWETGDECGATPGKCNDKWPTGSVWKADCDVVDGVAKCWRCYPPRYILDTRFAASFFVFLWNNAFNVALGQILIAMAVSVWFFTDNNQKGKVLILPKALKTVFRYHIGTVAFGSLIIAIVQFIRYLMKFFEKQAESQKNRVLVLVLKIIQCCIWCFEKCLKFLNKNAYIQTALNGTAFCTSARKAFFLILRNALRFATVATLSVAIHVIGFTSILVGTAIVGYFLVRAMHEDVEPTVPCLSYACIGYMVAKLFMNVFGLAVDTSLQCYLAVEEMGASGDFVPRALRSFVKKNVDKDDDGSSD